MLIKKQPTPQNTQPPAGPGNKAPNAPQRPQLLPGKVWLFFLMILLMNYVLGRFFAPDAEAPVMVPYTLFKAQVAIDNVQAVFNKGETINGKFRRAVTWPKPDSTDTEPSPGPSRIRRTHQRIKQLPKR